MSAQVRTPNAKLDAFFAALALTDPVSDDFQAGYREALRRLGSLLLHIDDTSVSTAPGLEGTPKRPMENHRP